MRAPSGGWRIREIPDCASAPAIFEAKPGQFMEAVKNSTVDVASQPSNEMKSSFPSGLPLLQPFDQLQHFAAFLLEQRKGADDQHAESDPGHVPQPTPAKSDRRRPDYRQQ